MQRKAKSAPYKMKRSPIRALPIAAIAAIGAPLIGAALGGSKTKQAGEANEQKLSEKATAHRQQVENIDLSRGRTQPLGLHFENIDFKKTSFNKG